MLKTLINAWNIKDIRSKMLYTLLLIVIYRFGSFIPVPGVDASKIAAAASQYDILSFLNLLSGGNFGQFTIFAMGISPYITGSIIIQLLTIAIPALERLAKEEDGRQKIERITRYTGIGLALVQSIGIVMGLQNQYGVVANPGFLTYLTIGIVCTAGTAFLVWLGERISEKGIGNGISFIIFASIVSQVPTVVVSMISGVIGGLYKWWILPVLLVFVLVMVSGVVAVDRAVRRIPVQYAKRVVGRKMYGGQSTNIPLKANANGVMPLIFAMTLIQVPAAAFLTGHILYLCAIVPLSRNLTVCLIAGVVLAAALLTWIFRTLTVKLAFKIFGVLYIGAIVLMTAVAIGNVVTAPGTAAWMHAVGAVLFTLSDIVLIFNTFGKEQKFSLRITNLSLYYLGQLLIAASLFFI